MNEENTPPNDIGDILWIGIGVLGALATCLLMTVVVIFSIFVSGTRSSSTSSSSNPPLELDLAEETLSILSSVEVPLADPPAIAERLLHIPGIPNVVGDGPLDLAVGALEFFWVTDVDNNDTIRAEAELAFVSEHVYFWIEKDLPYDLEDVRIIVENFESSTYSQIRETFGHEWSPGVDGDPHLYILYVRGIGSSVAGFYYSRDEYSSEAQEFSNEHEMFYLNADTVSLRDSYVESVLAHEFQHMVHWNLDRNEETWMTEGFSELAEHMLGFESSGFDFVFIRNPDIPLLIWPDEPGSTGAHYGQSFLFMTYLYNRFGEGAIRMIAQNPANGLDAIEQMMQDLEVTDPLTGEPLTVEDLFLEWGISLVLQDPDLADGRYGLQSYRSAPQGQFSESINECPLQEKALQVAQYGIDLIQISCRGEFELLFSGATHTRIVPSDPRSGSYAYWSNKGDESDMTLTRSFDLRETSGVITFDYWTWYQIEEGYDYVYLEASTDGGASWEILSTPSGTGEDPSGNSYGWAYNGTSGGGNSAVWIHESADISSYAGRELMLRFEYITDAALNTEGFLLDDLTIDAIGYKESFEIDSGGWLAEGFVRIHNLIPQEFKVALIERGGEVQINTIEIDSTGLAKVRLNIENDVEDVILVVAGTSRYSWMPAVYSIEIEK